MTGCLVWPQCCQTTSKVFLLEGSRLTTLSSQECCKILMSPQHPIFSFQMLFWRADDISSILPAIYIHACTQILITVFAGHSDCYVKNRFFDFIGCERNQVAPFWSYFVWWWLCKLLNNLNESWPVLTLLNFPTFCRLTARDIWCWLVQFCQNHLRKAVGQQKPCWHEHCGWNQGPRGCILNTG